MAASGFGREAGPSSRGPGSAVPAFGAGAATTPAPLSATSPFPSARSVSPLSASTSPFPSVRPATPPGVSTVPFSSARPASLLSAPPPHPSPLARPLLSAPPPHPSQLARPLLSAPPRRPSPPLARPPLSARPPLDSRALGPSSHPWLRPLDPPPLRSLRLLLYPPHARLLVSAPTLQHACQALVLPSIQEPSQQPVVTSLDIFSPNRGDVLCNFLLNDVLRWPAPQSVSRPVDPFISARSRALSPLSNPRAGSPTDYDNGMGERRLLNYADPLFENGTSQSSDQMMSQPSEFGNRARSPLPDTADSRDHVYKFSGSLQSRPLDHNISKRSRSPTLSYQNVDGAGAHRDASENTRRSNVSNPKFGNQTQSPKFGNQTQSRIGAAHSPPPQILDSRPNGLKTPVVPPPKPSILGTTKRMATPLDASDDGHAIPLTELEREEEAKAKRLARFHVELSRPVENTNDYVKTLKGPADKPKQATSVGKISMLSNDNSDERMDDMDSPELAAIVGLCPDMCPESERAERERKGDLDRYERLGGDRNQTTELLAVKKIRLHIIAMHELCEYNKGEGFSEGFDAHLNIEQMNKASVELFQMYDDHRRKGVLFPTEKEFRGYYALLKLDKHPGYKVEPAELSLDLAKMSREIRGSPEILFAREVARACRMGNFIAFFRLARKASYLQACLMHAHFAKLRRQALASLHSGLQNGQGIPISHAVEWLAMEDEDIESLLEYHGFGLRQYEELYLVKEGPFLNSESQDGSVTGFPQKVQMQTDIQWSEADTKPSAFEEPTVSHPYGNSISLCYSVMNGEEVEFRESDSGTSVDMDEGTPPFHEEPGSPIDTHLSGSEEYRDHNIISDTADDQLPIVMPQKTTISNERLKRILRKWSQRAADKRFLREQKNALAVAALSSLSLGPSVHNTTTVPKLAIHELDIGHALRERHARQQRSWSRLNISELSGPILLERNPDARCLCWKLLLLVPPGSMESQANNLTSRWLLRKLMGSGNEDGGLIFSSAGLSIWTEWISSPSRCCLSIVRASDQQVISDDITDSTSCIVFVVSEKISWEKQKVRFSSLLASVPAQSNLPLLILSCDTYNEGHERASQYIFERLGLDDLSGEKISSSLVVFLVENYMEGYGNGFFDDDNLRDGLKWLTRKLPLQPDVTLVKTYELLLDFLNLQLQMLSRHATPEIGPGDCISVFNDAVNQLAEEVLAAAHTNPNQWPALEIDHLENQAVKIFAEMFLPSTGWSLPSRIQPLLAAINSCKLPDFTYDLSWLNQGSLMGKQTQDQKLFLEDCLAGYLTESARLLNETHVATEVNIMVQKYVSLELRDSYYYLVPRWISIFRRIYNWRLAKISTGEFSEAYVLTQHLYQAPAAKSKGAAQHRLTTNVNTTNESSVFEDHSIMPAVSAGLCLDEIIGISCDLDDVDVRPANPLPPPLPTPIHEEPKASADSNSEVSRVHRVINGEMYAREEWI
ncbi:hypothetical protein PR202_gn00491 [Eleusine coracana subsp. coracana]|uniref:PCI domain-containing protein n=1 Tax=Eleusine coracana subsp. coracana TaxID=191504 RepID=A0AAV5G2P7_ELECO|nr:hypothetical protein PR202_gn00491 [Eleusine coracana subsp. coracana]